jgi:hypothetical protein
MFIAIALRSAFVCEAGAPYTAFSMVREVVPFVMLMIRPPDRASVYIGFDAPFLDAGAALPYAGFDAPLMDARAALPYAEVDAALPYIGFDAPLMDAKVAPPYAGLDAPFPDAKAALS